MLQRFYFFTFSAVAVALEMKATLDFLFHEVTNLPAILRTVEPFDMSRLCQLADDIRPWDVIVAYPFPHFSIDRVEIILQIFSKNS